MTVFIGSFFVVGILSSRMDRGQKKYENKKAEEKRAAEEMRRQDELSFFESIKTMPDDAALNRLVEHLGWPQVTGTIGIDKLHLDALQKVYLQGDFTLPNMQSAKFGSDERRVVSKIRETTTKLDDVGFYGLDAFSQEPTMQMLQDLINMGYATTAEPITKDSRTVQSEITPKGLSLLALNKRFEKTPFILQRNLSTEARKTVANVLRQCINS